MSPPISDELGRTTQEPENKIESTQNYVTDLSKDNKLSEKPVEHPEGDEIRRQVEYYFSDDNLPTDKHLLELCEGRKNVPISISRILGFKKMRQYKPKSQVVVALRKSAFLEVSKDGKTIKRKIPLRGPTILDEDDEDDLDTATLAEELLPAKDPRQHAPSVEAVKLKEKPSGFEEYSTTTPITPAEFEEARTCYHPDLPFSDRIQTAIQRYKSKHKFRYEIYAQVFNRWMKFGGVDHGQRQFTGKISQEELENYDAREIAHMLATHHVSEDRDDATKWVVAFESLAKAFLSSQLPIMLECTALEVQRSTQVLRTFYNYLLHHNVCPEYTESIKAAKLVCDKADKELPKVKVVGLAFPGKFNMACSTLFGGLYKSLYTENRSWASDDSGQMNEDDEIGLTKDEARVIFKTGIVAYATDDQYKTVESQDLESIPSSDLGSGPIGLEVIAVNRAPPDVAEMYATQNQAYGHKMAFPMLGKLQCKSWKAPDGFAGWDRPSSKDGLHKPNIPNVLEFWVEDEILDDCFVGMKLEAIIREVSIGIYYLDQVTEVYCSFYKYLPNELTMSKNIWKPIEWAEGRPEKKMQFDMDEYIRDMSGENPNLKIVVDSDSDED